MGNVLSFTLTAYVVALNPVFIAGSVIIVITSYSIHYTKLYEVSSGVCATILGVQGTTCSENNGSVTGTSSSDYSSTTFYLYHGDGVFSQSATTSQSTIEFGSLTAGTYYMTVLDLGGCTGQSASFIVEESEPLNYGLYTVPNSSCGGNAMGKIMIV